MIQAEISPNLIAVYRATEYQAAMKTESGSGTVILRIDEYSEALSRLFTASELQCAAFITACNPYSVPQSHEKNLMACARLRNKLDRQARPGWILGGESHDPSGAWPVEKSFLVLGLDLETSRALGNEFGQNAIVWVGPDAIPRLILLR